MNHMLFKIKNREMIRIPCNLDLSGGGGGGGEDGWLVEGFCCKVIDLNNDPDAVSSSSISDS